MVDRGPLAKMGNTKASVSLWGKNQGIYSGCAKSEGRTRQFHGKLKWAVGSMTMEPQGHWSLECSPAVDGA